MASLDRPWAYWSLGPSLVRLTHWDRHWAELSPFGLTLDDAVRLRDGLNHALKQRDAAMARERADG